MPPATTCPSSASVRRCSSSAVGETDANQAIAALSALRRSGGAQLDLFVAVANPSGADATRRLEIYADGALVDARDLSIAAGQRAEALVTTVPSSAVSVEARLAGSDALATDDRAFAIVPAADATRALLVGDGSAYLESALALLPRLELYAVSVDGYADALEAAAEAGTPYGLVIFDGVVPDEAPDAAALYVDPDADGAYGSVDGRIDGPLIEPPSADEPLLRFVDLASVHLGRARQVELAAGMRSVVTTPRDAPLIAVGEGAGERIGLVAFDLDESDLPLQVAFPLLVSNIVDYLLPTADGILPSSMGLGESLSVTLDPEVTGIAVTSIGAQGLPGAVDGEAPVELAAVDGRVTIPGAAAVGLREVRAISDDGAVDGTLLGTTAVNLFSADESDVAPGDPTRLTDMGRVPDDAPTSGQPTRTEWWWPLALVALALLAVEWILFHRPTRRTMARAFGRRPEPLAGRGR